MTIDAYCSQPHYADHLQPVWDALPRDVRGRFWVLPKRTLTDYATGLGLDVTWGTPAGRMDGLTLVAGAQDLPHTRRAILLCHGAGQRYEGLDHPAWPGGDGRHRVALFLVPNGKVAAANRQRYPETRNVIVGSPHVEQLQRVRRKDSPIRVVFSRHWDGGQLSEIVPELRSAWHHYHDAITAYAAGFPGEVALHAHPRCTTIAQRDAKHMGVPYIDTFEEVVATADVYVTDNSSTIFEWAALDRPVVLLDAPWYRRQVEHGLRFWSHANVGLRCGHPDGLASIIEAALIDPPMISRRRRKLIAEVFPIIDGAAQRAAQAIMELL